MDRLALMDIGKVGPGIWFKIHSDAVAAITQPLKESFVININALCNGFKCKHCQPYFRKYINDHPIEKYFNIKNKEGKDIGIYQWTWEFHNSVNLRLGKFQCTLEESYEYYINNTVRACYECGQNKNINIKDDVLITRVKNSDIIKNTNTNITKQVTVKYEGNDKAINASQQFKPYTFKPTQISNNGQSFPFKMYNK